LHPAVPERPVGVEVLGLTGSIEDEGAWGIVLSPMGVLNYDGTLKIFEKVLSGPVLAVDNVSRSVNIVYANQRELDIVRIAN